MGATGMGDMGELAMHMPMPQNSIPMLGAPGLHDYISMSRSSRCANSWRSYNADPGWYQNPPGTQATVATKADLERDGIQI